MKYNVLKIISKIILGISIFAGLGGCDDNATSNKVEQPIIIGATLPLTGDMGAWGERAKKGLLIGLDQANKNRKPSDQFKVIFEDTRSSPSIGVTVLTKLINTDHIKFVVGDLSSGVTLAMAPIVEREKILLLSPGSSSPAVRDAGDYIFRDWTSDDYDGEVLAQVAKSELGAKTVAVYYQDSTYAQGLADAFKKVAGKIGLEIVVMDQVSGTDKNYKSVLAKYAAKNPADVIFFAGLTEQSASFFRQAREIGIKQKLMGCVAIESPDFLKIFPNANDVYFTTIPLDPEKNPVFADFSKKYKALYGEMPDVAAAHAYDAIMLFDHVIKSKNTQVDEARLALLAVKNFPGATGIMSFDDKGDVKKPVAFKKYENGKPVFIKQFGFAGL